MTKINYAISGLCIALGLAIIAFLSNPASATNFPQAIRGNTINALLISASGTTTTNTVGSSTNVEGVLYHSFQAINGSVAQQFAIDWSLDNTNFVPDSTNAVAASGTAGVTKTGKWSYIRIRQIGTNSTLSVYYLGGN